MQAASDREVEIGEVRTRVRYGAADEKMGGIVVHRRVATDGATAVADDDYLKDLNGVYATSSKKSKKKGEGDDATDNDDDLADAAPQGLSTSDEILWLRAENLRLRQALEVQVDSAVDSTGQ